MARVGMYVIGCSWIKKLGQQTLCTLAKIVAVRNIKIASWPNNFILAIVLVP